MEIILARHGNTFGPNDKVVMAGLTNDIPLVQKGGEQAEMVAKWLKKENIKPSVYVCSELCRTKRSAEIVMEQLLAEGEPIVDPRVNELDYGLWTGLSDDEINAQFGETYRENWQQNAVWPSDAQWGQSPEDVTKEVQEFAHSLVNFCEGDHAFVVTHGGRLRYFLKLIDGAFEQAIENNTLKVKTGHVCRIKWDGEKFSLISWNQNPADLIKEAAA